MPLSYFRQMAREVPGGVTLLRPARTIAWPMRTTETYRRSPGFLTEPRHISSPPTEPATLENDAPQKEPPQFGASTRDYPPEAVPPAVEARVVTAVRDGQHREQKADHRRGAATPRIPRPLRTAETIHQMQFDEARTARQTVEREAISRETSRVVAAGMILSPPAEEARGEPGDLPRDQSRLAEPSLDAAPRPLAHRAQKFVANLRENEPAASSQRVAPGEVHIGSIEVVVTPVVAPNVSRKAEPKVKSPLSRGYVTRWGLRQG